MALRGLLGGVAAIGGDAIGNALILGVPIIGGFALVCWALKRPVRAYWREIVLAVGFYGGYSVLRDRLVGDPRALALAHAHSIIGVERSLRLYVEPWAAGVYGHLPALVQGYGARFYDDANTVVTCFVFTWLAVSRGEDFRRWRNVLGLASVGGLAVFWLYPVAPPRFVVGYGFVDHVAPGLDRLALVDAAMPSFHTLWAGWVAAAAFGLGLGGRWRWAWWLHPVLTVAVIVGTSNHWLLDAVGAEVLLLASALSVKGWESASVLASRRWRARWSRVVPLARAGVGVGLESRPAPGRPGPVDPGGPGGVLVPRRAAEAAVSEVA